MEFWNSLLTEKSWKKMQELKGEHFRFVVIGGWAAYLWTRQHKSKDIDILLPDIKDLDFLRQKYSLNKNDALKKYEIKFEDIDLDIYTPYYSRLTLPIEDISKETSFIEGFEVILPEILLILKQGAENDRRDSVKGQKDRIDIMTLLCYAKIDFGKYHRLLKKYKLESYRLRLKEIIRAFRDFKHLNLNLHEYSKVKKKLLSTLGEEDGR
ncbi:hypothetical protein J4457_00415 [Candidatus Woesearchaeota archaeon]|nr:hypothetical protein [Candidatus Woesearchaeota archaeon]